MYMYINYKDINVCIYSIYVCNNVNCTQQYMLCSYCAWFLYTFIVSNVVRRDRHKKHDKLKLNLKHCDTFHLPNPQLKMTH